MIVRVAPLCWRRQVSPKVRQFVPNANFEHSQDLKAPILMTLLLSVTGWDPFPWISRFRGLLPGFDVLLPGETTDSGSVRYAATWKHAHGSLSTYPHLRAIFSLGAGVDHLISDPGLPDVPILRVVDDNLTSRMSEYIVMQCLMHLRKAWTYEKQQRRQVWLDFRDQPAACDVRVGVMGLGNLGFDAANKLAMMGFQVGGWVRSQPSRPIDNVSIFTGYEALDQFLARTDILVVLLPLTPATCGILNKPLFAKLARDGRLEGPVLINAGRGALQTETDIIESLDDGTLSAVSLDVFEAEPLPSTSRLWLHPRVHITPHNAAMSDPDAIAKAIVEQIRRHERGLPFINQVDIARGY
jgi:glyoxylate/hydroxypyruvate reductase